MTAVAAMPHILDRTVTIGAPPAVVFRFFTDDARWSAWWGAGSTIDARPGGRVYIRHPGGVEASGEVLEIAPPDRIVFTYGFESGKPMAPGTSRVTIRLAPHPDGTRLTLAHEFADLDARDHHVQGWRYQLSLFANVVADEVNAGAAKVVDAWFTAWSLTDPGERTRVLSAVAVPTLRFRDKYGATDGVDDLVPHIGAAQHFMPGIRLVRDGDIRHCQGTLLANWKAVAPDGSSRGQGTNVYQLNAECRITGVTGFWT
jgi:uncharacterized protein YndB with AHSA1/START domain